MIYPYDEKTSNETDKLLFCKTYGGSKWDQHPKFWLNFLVRFWVFFLYIYIPYTISCQPFSNVSKISVYIICLEIYLCILNSEFYVMHRISLHSMWQITTKHFKVIHWHFVIDKHCDIAIKTLNYPPNNYACHSGC